MQGEISPLVDRGTCEPVSLGAVLVAGKKVAPDATLLLTQDHREAMGYLDWYETAADRTEKQLERIENYPQVRERLEAHLEEKNAQLARVQEILESLGERPSTMKDAAMKMGGKLTTMMSAGTEDEIVKNSLAMFGLASFEAASYESLVVLATAARQQAAARKLQECLSEERAMSAWLAENLTGVVLMHLQYRSEGVPASR